MAILTTSGVLYLLAAVSGRDEVAPLTGALSVCSLLLLLTGRGRPFRR